ncbi:MAG: hypothetical protein K1X88_11990 [Nannocystaceae bacterium]|nr:hypothetical protein [Nannocystaceae bacterium]
MVQVATDVPALLHRREVVAYEQRLARVSYAYGVDLRRSAWLSTSTLGDPLIRSVDRSWNELVAELSGSILQDPARAAPVPLMEEIARLAHMLRAPLPGLRQLVRSSHALQWPLVAALGTTRAAVQWLVVDSERLMALPAHERTFLLAGALADLQCDHAPVITAHLLAYRSDRGLGLVRTLLSPWAKVGMFSCDRAGLIGVGDLQLAMSAMRAHADNTVPWLPTRAPLDMREPALADFDRSTTMARLRVLLRRQAESNAAAEAPTVAGAPRPAQTQTPEGETPPDAPDESDAPTREGGESSDPYRHEAKPQSAAPPPSDDEELARALAGAWSLARCDARLTRRLGLL